MQVSKKNKIIICCILLVVVFLGTRIFALDQDLPPWGVINYQPIDEGAYSMLALNKNNYGEINPEIVNGDIEYENSNHIRINIVGNVFSFVTLNTFGDNYFGLRMASVICGLFNFLLFGLILRKLAQRYGGNTKFNVCVALGCLLYFLIDFALTMSGRVVETTSFRLLFTQLVVLFSFYFNDKKILKFAILSGLVTLSVFGVYITNIFLYLACAILCIGIGITEGKKEFFKAFLGCIIGGLCVFALCECYYFYFWGIGGIENAIAAINSFVLQSGYELTSGFYSFMKTTIIFLSANVNLYSTVILVGVACSLPLCIYHIIKKKDMTILFFLSILISFYLQVCVSEDYVVRKFLVVYPILFYILYILIITEASGNGIIDKFKQLSQKKRYIYYGYLFLCFLLPFGIYAFRLFLLTNGTVADFTKVNSTVIIVLGTASVLLFFGGLLYILRNGVLKKGRGIILFVVAICCAATVNLYMDYEFILDNKTYTEKQAMIDLGKEVDDAYVIGPVFPIGYTLYNDIKPIIGQYKHIYTALDKHNNIYYLDYSEGGENGIRQYLNEVFQDENYKIVSVREFRREFQTFGVSKNMGLYEAVKYTEKKVNDKNKDSKDNKDSKKN